MKQSIQGMIVALTGLIIACALVAWVVVKEYQPPKPVQPDASSQSSASSQNPWAIPDKIAATGSDMADAEQFVKQTCVACHGADLKGQVGPNLYDMSKQLSLQQIQNVLKNGKQDGAKQMPAGLVPTDKIPEIAKFIKALSTTSA